MQSALVVTGFLTGLAAGPHCVAMCGAACAGVVRVVHVVRGPVGSAATARAAAVGGLPGLRAMTFHAGRIAGYAAGGAVAAAALQTVSWASESTAMLRPLWLLLHVGIFVWGLVLMVCGRQPFWTQRLTRGLDKGLRAITGSGWRVAATGALWVAMPCGLLYSALLLAALANTPVHGALVMAAFATGSGLALVLAPWLWQRLRGWRSGRQEWGARIAGAVLAAVALQAVWHDLQRQILLWCQ